MVSTFLFKSSHRWNRQMILSPCICITRILYSCTPNAKRAAAHQPQIRRYKPTQPAADATSQQVSFY